MASSLIAHVAGHPLTSFKERSSICRIYMTGKGMPSGLHTGDDLLRALAALANPHRLRILATLTKSDRPHVSQLARLVGISRPLLYLHLEKLEAAGLVHSELGLSTDGKAMRRYDASPFSLTLSPALIARLACTLTDIKEKKG